MRRANNEQRVRSYCRIFIALFALWKQCVTVVPEAEPIFILVKLTLILCKNDSGRTHALDAFLLYGVGAITSVNSLAA
jgi:hypothetical protein